MEGKHSISEPHPIPENLNLVDLRSLWGAYTLRAHAKESGHFLHQMVHQAAMAAIAESHRSLALTTKFFSVLLVPGSSRFTLMYGSDSSPLSLLVYVMAGLCLPIPFLL